MKIVAVSLPVWFHGLDILEMMTVDHPMFDAWVAGFFDGEGCVIVSKCANKGVRGGWNYYLMTCITQQDRRPLELIKEKFGGAIRFNQSVKSSYVKKKGHVYTWSCVMTGAASLRLLAAIQPYCVVKSEQVKEALRYPLNTGKVYRGPGNSMPDSERALRAEIRDNLVAIRESVKVYANIPTEVGEA